MKTRTCMQDTVRASHPEESSVVFPMLRQNSSHLKALGPNKIITVAAVVHTLCLWNTSEVNLKT